MSVEAYHERTKHHYHRFAASLGHLDWATQPEAFRWFEGAPSVRLPLDIRTRRSAVAFDPEATMPRAALLRMLDRTLARDAAPFDALPWAPRVHLVLFVHRVRDLEPGLHVLVRRPGAADGLRAALRPDLEWARPEGVPSGFPLHRLSRGDLRETAAALSCGQEIAGDSCFGLGMLAEFASTLRDRGPAGYRDLFREAGAVGHVLYLEAEAEGYRGTGIGCYFDDPVHDLLGLRDRELQSLYHFTVGTPVEDPRLRSLPAYG